MFSNTHTLVDHVKSRMAIAFYFALAGLSFSSWAVRTPYIQEYLMLDKVHWGLLLLCPVVTSLSLTLLSNFLIGHFTSRRTTIAGSILVVLSLALIGWSYSMPSLALSFLVFGAGMGLINVSMNDQAAALERLYQRSIMSSFHGIFSLGAMIGSLVGGLFAKLAISPAYHLSFIAGCLCIGGLFAQKHLLPSTVNITDVIKHEIKISLIVMPQGAFWVVGAIAAATVFIEGSMADWSALYLENMGAKEWLSAFGLAFFTGTMALGRMIGDRWVDYLGSLKAIQIGAASAIVGLLIALISYYPVVAIIGFAIAGIGMAVIFPCLLSLAATVKSVTMPSSAAIASVAMMGYVSMLSGPPMIGFLAHIIGLHLAFVALLASALLALSLTLLIPAKD